MDLPQKEIPQNKALMDLTLEEAKNFIHTDYGKKKTAELKMKLSEIDFKALFM